MSVIAKLGGENVVYVDIAWESGGFGDIWLWLWLWFSENVVLSRTCSSGTGESGRGRELWGRAYQLHELPPNKYKYKYKYKNTNTQI